MAEADPSPASDPVIEACRKDVGRTSLRQNLRRTAEERIRNLQALARFAGTAPRRGALAGPPMTDFEEVRKRLLGYQVEFTIAVRDHTSSRT